MNRALRSSLTRGMAGLRLFADYAPGTKIPINIMKDGKDPVIMEDKEYPEWLFKLTEPLPSKAQLLVKYEESGIDSLTVSEARRLKKLVTLEDVKDYNSSSSMSAD